MAKRKKSASITDFTFFEVLWQFYSQNRGAVRQNYRDLTKKYLDFNNPEKNPHAFLRQPQFEALEIYVFLKEFLDNAHVEHIFESWLKKEGRFAGREEGGIVRKGGSATLFDTVTEKQYEAVFKMMKRNARVYPNYIFALTMGTGKTILMATCIFYEFILSNKFPKDKKYCHNALVFAPDKTVLQSLREIESFDLKKVVPPEYVNLLSTHLQFHYLDNTGTSLNTIDGSRFNLVVSNTQKIILKKKHKESTATETLFGAEAESYSFGGVYDELGDLYEFDRPEDEAELTTNQRFEKLARLQQLGIYVDEAHHAFGQNLAKDMGVKKSETSLRTTIDKLASKLDRSGTHVVACYNYTGTPYVGKEVLPEVVYAYGLRESIEKQYLKRVRLHGYSNTKSEEFVRITINNFLQETEGLRPEDMLPKLAFFGATIEEVQSELRPIIEEILHDKGIPLDRILVNVGDTKVTANDDIREFNRLDTPESEKQFILLVNKGREGWNCRSLFGVGLFRKPKSKVFVLQSTMRCLRSIGDVQYTGQVYLSEENMQILDDELQDNFRISAEEFQQTGNDNEIVQIRVKEPPRKIKLKRVKKTYHLKDKELQKGISIGINNEDTFAWNELTKNYHIIETAKDGLETPDNISVTTSHNDLTHVREKIKYSTMTLVAEIARYLNRSPIEIEELLDSTTEGTNKILDAVNLFNELLYDKVIPELFANLYEIEQDEETEEHEVELIKMPQHGYYEMSAPKDKIVRDSDVKDEILGNKSFHLDTYCFDSNPEKQLFWDLLRQNRVKEIYFTGMLTHGQSDFFVQYIDPETHMVRSYYPDFLVKEEDDSYLIVEVKGDNMIDDTVVRAKQEYAEQLAAASGMKYQIIKGTDAIAGHYQMVFGENIVQQQELEIK